MKTALDDERLVALLRGSWSLSEASAAEIARTIREAGFEVVQRQATISAEEIDAAVARLVAADVGIPDRGIIPLPRMLRRWSHTRVERPDAAELG